MNGFLEQQLRQLLFLLDNIVYPLIEKVYELIVYLSNINLMNNNEVIAGLIGRIYLLLGIFMLFKVSFSMLQYLIDPNSFSDGSKGFGKLVTNVLVAVVLLVSVPFIFKEAYVLQEKIINSNVIPNLILGEKLPDYTESSVEEGDVKSRQKQISSMARDVEFAMYGAFYTLNTDPETGVPECEGSNIIGSKAMAANCFEAFKTASADEMKRYNLKYTDFFKYKGSGENCIDGVCDDRDFSSFGKLLYWQLKGDGTKFTINYVPLVSVLAGGYVLLLLITFAIDIAARAFKLMFLQAIAPIAIVSYVDPKESVSQGKLHNWAMECVKTYVSLFLRLAIIFLILQIVRLLSSLFITVVDGSASNLYYNGVAPDQGMSIWIYLLLVLGIFTFAKKVPQMIESIFGIKMSGDLQLNPFKHEGLQLGGAGAAALGAGAMVGASNFLAATEGSRKVIGSGLDAFNGKDGTIRERIKAANSAVGMTMAGKSKSEWDAMSDKAKRRATVAGGYHGLGAFGGVFTGAVSGAARGASKGLTAKPNEIIKNARTGLKEAREARVDRDARQKQNMVSRVTNAYQEFAGTSGVGAQNSEINKQIQHLMGQKRNAEQAAMAQNEKRANMNISGFYRTDSEVHSHILNEVRNFGGDKWKDYSDAKAQEELAKMDSADLNTLMSTLASSTEMYDGTDRTMYREYLESHIQDMKETQSAIELGKQIKTLQASIGKKDDGGGSGPLK